jgi:hypothetical protein
MSISIAVGSSERRLSSSSGKMVKIAHRIMSSNTVTEDLPVHFFTIVLNGEPFIRYHLDAFKDLPFRWHWHVVEGVAKLVHDTAWSVASGGTVDESLQFQGRSNDGTSEYLDRLAAEYPENISIYRKAPGVYWEGKLEMVRAPLPNLPDDCLLWQIDADEFWARAQVIKMRKLFLAFPEKTAAWFWCHYFVGPKLVVSSRNCYSQNPAYDWLRVWRYRAGMDWASHEPPRLLEKRANGEATNVGTARPFLHEETERNGLIFQHFAYVLPQQIAFKEAYYGYQNAGKEWRRLQQGRARRLHLKNYFSWVRDRTTVVPVDALGITPIASFDCGSCQFLAQDQIQPDDRVRSKASVRMMRDSLFSRVKSRLSKWRRSLSRAGRKRP